MRVDVYDKTGLIELARALEEGSTELLASGGTRPALVNAGLRVPEVRLYRPTRKSWAVVSKRSIPRFTLESWHAATSPQTSRRSRHKASPPSISSL